MKYLLALLPQLAIVFVAVAQSPAGYRSEADIRKGPKDILEYYMILPDHPYFRYDDQSGLSEFDFRKKYLQPLDKRKIVIDKANAFMSIVDNTNELTYYFTMVYFIKADGKKIIAAWEDQEGGDCDSYSFNFYQYENEKFTDITSQLLPTITMKDFCSSVPGGKYAQFDPIYELPHYGTVIKVSAAMICEQDDRMRGLDMEEYYKKFRALPCKPVELLWNKASGTFTLKK